ncbi:hypothetical protein FXO37_18744 [Capsicum annuum]|nr:hypothetical protein FXO37_18744 [Capsicum annuum]
MSWIEMGLRGHATTFSVEINGVQLIVVLQNEKQLAQFVIGGMRITLENFVDHMWIMNNLNPSARTTLPGFLQTMQGLWNLPHYPSPYPNLSSIAQTPFLTPGVDSSISIPIHAISSTSTSYGSSLTPTILHERTR